MDPLPEIDLSADSPVDLPIPPPPNSSKPVQPLYPSPFTLPSDEEVFKYREAEKLRKSSAKQDSRFQKIWQKKTASSQNPLHHYKDYGVEKSIGGLPAEDRPKIPGESLGNEKRRGYGIRERTLIAGAMEILKGREKIEENGKEGVIELIEQKKEMFLVSMAHGILENEIERLKMINAEKQEALEQSRKMLDKDREDFARHFENNKQLTEMAQHVQ